MLELTRRGFIGGTSAIAASASLPLLRNGGTATRPLAGATVNLGAYHVESYLDAASIYDHYVGLPLATTFQKVYMTQGLFGSAPPEKMAQLAKSGCRFLVSVEPSRHMTRSEQSVMAEWLAMLRRHGMSFRVVLYSECNDKEFTTAEEWLPYWRFYAPVIRDAGLTLCYEPGCGPTSVRRGEAFFPSKPSPDEMWLDYYATAFRGGSNLNRVLEIAGAARVPAGLGEWGWEAGRGPVHDPMTMRVWDEYGAYLIELISARKIQLGAMHFAADADGRSVDVITGPKDPRIPMIRNVVKAVYDAQHRKAAGSPT